MQERYLVERAERFETIVRLIRETQHSLEAVLDLGCGTGSLMSSVLEAFPEASVTGIDFDPARAASRPWIASGEATATPSTGACAVASW